MSGVAWGGGKNLLPKMFAIFYKGNWKKINITLSLLLLPVKYTQKNNKRKKQMLLLGAT